MTNTGTNFFARFGDRLPTRETKSRGRLNYITSQNGQRGRSLADQVYSKPQQNDAKQQLSNEVQKNLRMSNNQLTKSSSREKMFKMQELQNTYNSNSNQKLDK